MAVSPPTQAGDFFNTIDPNRSSNDLDHSSQADVGSDAPALASSESENFRRQPVRGRLRQVTIQAIIA